MQHDLDRLMSERHLDAIVVEGPDGLGSANPAFNYFVRGAHLTGLVIKKLHEPAMLIHSDWELLQAEATGLVCVSSSRWNIREISRQFPERLAARVELRRQMLTDLGVAGRVGLYGTVQIGPFLTLLRGLEAAMPELSFVAEFDKDLLSAARLTKDAAEVEVMRAVGRKTCEVVQAAVDFIAAGVANGDDVCDATTGTPLTIGDVRRVIDRELAARGLVGEGTIFAQGRDAGLPHARGEDVDAGEGVRAHEADDEILPLRRDRGDRRGGKGRGLELAERTHDEAVDDGAGGDPHVEAGLLCREEKFVVADGKVAEDEGAVLHGEMLEAVDGVGPPAQFEERGIGPVRIPG
ncbi:MAG: hypothetical protein EBS29_06455, partial [Chloroflexia bacterium]|nr:hypothetical protein [Chloroflexia bacterium]